MTRARDFADVISGQFDLPSGALDNATPADGSITAVKLASGAVTTVKIAADAITNAKIAADAITSTEIADDAVVAAAIADDAVGTAAIADDAITSALIADDAVVSAAIADGAVDTAQLAADAADNTIVDLAGNYAFTGNIGGLRTASITSNGLGDTNISTSYANINTTKYKWELPESGTYLIIASLRTRLWGVSGLIQYRLYNNTDSSVVSNSQQLSFESANVGYQYNVMGTPQWLLTVSAAKTIYLQGKSNNNSTNSSLQSDSNGFNVCTWVRLR